MKLRIRHGAITVWTTLGSVTVRPGTARGWLAGLLAVAVVTNLAGCERPAPSSTTAPGSAGRSSATSIVVFAATSLKPPLTLLAGKFQTDNPGATIDFNFATSSELANKLTQGAAADVQHRFDGEDHPRLEP